METSHRSAGGARPLLLLCLILMLLQGLLASCRREPSLPGRRSFRDGLGRTVDVQGPPRRLVSLAPSVTEALLALGAQDRLVGISDFCVLPPGSPPVARVGGLLNPSLETIRGLRPDVVIGTTSGNDPSLARETAAVGLPLYITHTPDVESVLRSLLGLSELIGEPERGRVLVADLRARLQAVAAAVAEHAPVSVLFVVWGEPLVVPGRSSFLTDGLTRAGGRSVTSDAPAAYPAFEVESAIARAPEVILTTPHNRALLERFAKEAAWAGVPAVTSGRLVVVSEAIEQPGPQVVAGIEEVARTLHPDAFARRSDEAPSRASPGKKKAVRARGPHGGGIEEGHPSALPQ